jgi:hypothetical protein
VKRRLRGKGKLRGILRPAYPDLSTHGEFIAAVTALIEGGVTELAFYNWGHLRSVNVGWIAQAAKLLEGRHE